MFLWDYSIAKSIHLSIKTWFNVYLCQAPFQVMGYENDQESGLEEHAINVDHIPAENRIWQQISKEKNSPSSFDMRSDLDDEISGEGHCPGMANTFVIFLCHLYSTGDGCLEHCGKNSSEHKLRWWERILWLISDVCCKWRMREWLHIFAFSGAVERQQSRSLYRETQILFLATAE